MNYEARRSRLIFTFGEDVRRSLSCDLGRRAIPAFHSLVEDRDIYVRDDTCVERSVVLLYVGRVNNGQKAFEVLLAAGYALIRRGLEFKLKCVGPIEEDVAAQLGKGVKPVWLEMVGYVEHGADLLLQYRMADIFVHVTRHEGLAKSVIEAMSQSVPVVMTLVDGNEGLFTHRQNCMIVPVDDPEATADAILEVACSKALRRQLIANGCKTAGSLTASRARSVFQTKIEEALSDSDVALDCRR